MAAKARAPRPAARAATFALPRAQRRPRLAARAFARFAPSRRSLALCLGILAFAAGAYAVACETSLFAIRDVAVEGGSAQVDAEVRQAVAPLLGTSLVGLDGASVVRRVESLPTVVSVSYDRAFPHTLRLTVLPERPVAVLRSGAEAWLVSARGRVMARLARPQARPDLPRIWLGSHTSVALGALLPPAEGGADARAVGLAGAFASSVGSASDAGGSLLFQLRSGLQLRLGDPDGVRLKMAVARRALRVLPAGTTYLDLSVPGRPVAGTGTPPPVDKPQVSTRASG